MISKEDFYTLTEGYMLAMIMIAGKGKTQEAYKMIDKYMALQDNLIKCIK